MTRSARNLAMATALAALLLVACGSSEDGSGGATDTTVAAGNDRLYGSPSETPVAGGDAAMSDGAVGIKDFAFNPGDATVATGTTVTWTNEDGTPHKIKSGDGSFDSENLDQGDTFEHTFDTAGTFDYVCGLHPQMSGTITVEG